MNVYGTIIYYIIEKRVFGMKTGQWKKRRAPRALRWLLLTAALVAVLYFPVSAQIRNAMVVHRVDTPERVVALTFDDGPHPLYTAGLLDVLDHYHVRGTFFMIGRQVDRYPGIARAVALRGHEIGNHTYTHPRGMWKISESKAEDEIRRCETSIRRATGRHTTLFRAPRGSFGSRTRVAARDLGYTTAHWSLCADKKITPTPEGMARRVAGRARPGDIILVHDGRTAVRWRDVVATALIIEKLQARGFKFVTVSQLMGRKRASFHDRVLDRLGLKRR